MVTLMADNIHMADEPLVQARCLHCKQVLKYHARAAKITLFTSQAMIFEFFCVGCKEYNRQRILNLDVAKALSDAGVPTTVVHVPLEVIERGEGGKSLTRGDAAYFEATSLSYFNRLAETELAGISLDPQE